MPASPDPGFLAREYDTALFSRDREATMARWEAAAARARREHPPEVVAYGRGPRQRIDLYRPAGVAAPPVLVFVHGGYWQRRSREDFAWLATPWLARGVAVALPGYPLCPTVTLARLVERVRAAVATVWRLAPRLGLSRRFVISGHSAGGHMAAALAATDWPARDPAMQAAPFAGCVAVSGVFELPPLLGSPLNVALRLDYPTALALSAMFTTPPRGLPFIAAVGALESGEFHRQTREMAARWGALGARAAAMTLAECDHFTALEQLAEPGAPLFAATAGLLGVGAAAASPVTAVPAAAAPSSPPRRRRR